MLPTDVVSAIELQLDASVVRTQSLSGGCISHATRVDTDRGPLFVKWSREEAAATFPAEAVGLQALRDANAGLVIPEPIIVSDGMVRREADASCGFLVLEWIETGERSRDYWESLGAGLAALHRKTSSTYGFKRDNYIGSLPQHNAWSETWPGFFRSRRLEVQVSRAREVGHWNEGWNGAMDRLMNRLDELLPASPSPSMLHGDLWSGNVMVTERGTPALIDPAVYYGHREVDLAMSELFGGFSSAFYQAYREAWPLESGYNERRQVYNLYHLINHLNHFGSGYAESVAGVLRSY